LVEHYKSGTKIMRQLETRTARQRLPVSSIPIYARIETGLSIGYRKNASGGVWTVRLSNGRRGNLVKRIGSADDAAPADGKALLDWPQACAAARRLRHTGTVEEPKKITTFGDAIDSYAEDLERRGGDAVNVSRIRKHMTPQLAGRALALIDSKEFRQLRDRLAKKMSTVSVDRTCRGIKAACNLVAEHDASLDRHAWTSGLALIKEKSPQRYHVPLAEPVIAQIVAACRAQSVEFGNLCQVLAETGCRCSQAVRIEICDLLSGDMLNIPVSNKGRGEKEVKSYALPISSSLAARLRVAAGDRAVTEPLLLRPDGHPWRHSDEDQRFREAVTASGHDAARVTAYSLRHSWIIGALLKNVPARLVAANADTSLAMLEKTYSRYIRTGGDSLMRAALPKIELPEADINQLRS
jgi:integrase